jgi:IS30 family transposase
MIELRADGKSIRTIAEELGLSKTTVCIRLHRHSDEVENAIALAKETLLEQLKVDQVAVFESKLRLFLKLQEQIEQRDYSDVPTDRLVKAWVSLGADLKV